MGIDTKNPPLPAPTESSTENHSDLAPTDLATNISRRTDRTSYSIPEDGSPLTLSTNKLGIPRGRASEASLLIEYFEVAHNASGRPSVRVKISPSNKKRNEAVSLLPEQRSYLSRPSDLAERSPTLSLAGAVNYTTPHKTARSDIEHWDIEGKRNGSPAEDGYQSQYLHLTSDISSMPAESMIESTFVSQVSAKKHASQQSSDDKVEQEPTYMDTLKAPSRPRSRSVSKERITKKVLEKLAREQSPEHHISTPAARKRRPTSSSTDHIMEHSKLRSRKSSRSYGGDDGASITESSVLNARDRDSNLSGISKSSLNPKLLQTVEDVVRRLILPEIETIKRQQSTRETSAKLTSRPSSKSLDPKLTDSDLSLSASTSYSKPKVVLNRDKDEPGQTLSDYSTRRRKHRRSSRESDTSKHKVLDGFSERPGGAMTSRDVDEGVATKPDRGALTVAALNSHNSQSSLNSFERERRQRRRQRNQTHSRSLSSHALQHKDDNPSKDSPYMPMQSEMADSELTRESILSAETVEADSSVSGQHDEHLASVHEVKRRSPSKHALTSTPGNPQSSHSNIALKATKSDKGLSSKGRKAALMAAGFGAGSSALYGHTGRSSRQNSGEHKPNPISKATDRSDTVRLPVDGMYDESETPHNSDVYAIVSPKKAIGGADSPSRIRSVSQENGTVKQSSKEVVHTKLASSYRPDISHIGQRASASDAPSDPVPSSDLIESQVASLLDPSTVGSVAEQSDKVAREVANHEGDIHERSSAERWATLRDNAQQRSIEALSADNVESAFQIESDHQGVDYKENMHPVNTTRSSQFNSEHDPSILEGQLGDEQETRGQWPYEPTPPTRSIGSALSSNDFADDHNLNILETPSGLGIAAVAHASHAPVSKRGQLNHNSLPSLDMSPSAFDLPRTQADSITTNNLLFTKKQEPAEEVDGVDKLHAQAIATDSPLSFSKGVHASFEDDQDIQPSYDQQQPGSTLFQNKYPSAHGTKASLYDSATGNGLHNIQSRDVVALMDHLTVRDGQRNARDTEILVTLVRSAAEMRNSFEDMKRFVEAQHHANMQRGDLSADRSVNKALSGHNGSRNSPSSRIARSSSAAEESPNKKKNIFQRALKGLGGRNTADLNRMEDMLVQILEEVEALRAVHTGIQLPGQTMRGLDRTEQLSDEPVAHLVKDAASGTTSSRANGDESGLSTQRFRQADNLLGKSHSAYQDTAKVGNHTVSQDVSEDEEWRTPSPSNEARETMKQTQEPTDAYSAQPLAGGNPPFLDFKEGHSRHKSTGSSLFGIPKVSRWSKTTASSIPNTPNHRSQRSSQQTKWGSDIHDDGDDNRELGEPDNEVQGAQTPDATNVHRDRATSPLIPESLLSFEEAKYQANRHSLTLQHPQPRQGPNQKQRSLMETQARAYGGISPGVGPTSPQSDTFGSFPALARINRFSGSQEYRPATLSPLSSQGDGTALRSKGAAVDPLVPSQPAGVSLYSHERNNLEDTYSSDAHSDDFDDGYEHWIEPVPLARKQSPYSPGGLLAPIEERYSLEHTRSSISATPAQERLSNSGSRSETPQQTYRTSFSGLESPTSRKIAGPREMPYRSRTSSREKDLPELHR